MADGSKHIIFIGYQENAERFLNDVLLDASHISGNEWSDSEVDQAMEDYEAASGDHTVKYALQRHTQCTLNFSKNIIKSEEIQPDRTTADFTYGTGEITGDILTELTVTGNRLLFMNLLMDSPGPTGGTDLPTRLRPGNNRYPLSIIRGFARAGDNLEDYDYYIYNNVEIASVNLSATPGDNVKCAFTLLGRSAQELVLSSPAAVRERNDNFYQKHVVDAGSYGLAINHPTFHTIDTSARLNTLYGFVQMGTEELSSLPMRSIITEFQLTLDNSMESRFVLGDRTGIEPSVGRLIGTGTVTLYFDQKSDYDMFFKEQDNIRMVLKFSATDEDSDTKTISSGSNFMSLILYRVKFESAQLDVTTPGPIVIPMAFECLRDSQGRFVEMVYNDS